LALKYMSIGSIRSEKFSPFQATFLGHPASTSMMGSQLQRAQYPGAGAVSIPHNLLVLMCKARDG